MFHSLLEYLRKFFSWKFPKIEGKVNCGKFYIRLEDSEENITIDVKNYTGHIDLDCVNVISYGADTST